MNKGKVQDSLGRTSVDATLLAAYDHVVWIEEGRKGDGSIGYYVCWKDKSN